ncbi:MAG: DUF559 domain-containing protein [Desulfovibrionaceae bacterium]|nr:DUF559 domain-containing protein [Desulfovibrionaceae bacterium]
MTRAELLAYLKNRCDSKLERDWLDTLESCGLNLPDKAQHYLKCCHTKPDFWYEKARTAIYIDGPAHDYPDKRKHDEETDECLEDRGITSLRFAHDEQWVITLVKYPSIFGTMK